MTTTSERRWWYTPGGSLPWEPRDVLGAEYILDGLLIDQAEPLFDLGYGSHDGLTAAFAVHHTPSSLTSATGL